MTILDRLEELERQATAGPWIKRGFNVISERCVQTPGNTVVADCFSTKNGREERNSALIAALRNAAPALIAIAREAEQLKYVGVYTVENRRRTNLQRALAALEALK